MVMALKISSLHVHGHDILNIHITEYSLYVGKAFTLIKASHQVEEMDCRKLSVVLYVGSVAV